MKKDLSGSGDYSGSGKSEPSENLGGYYNGELFKRIAAVLNNLDKSLV